LSIRSPPITLVQSHFFFLTLYVCLLYFLRCNVYFLCVRSFFFLILPHFVRLTLKTVMTDQRERD
jgi:hypothetical protein